MENQEKKLSIPPAKKRGFWSLSPQISKDYLLVFAMGSVSLFGVQEIHKAQAKWRETQTEEGFTRIQQPSQYSPAKEDLERSLPNPLHSREYAPTAEDLNKSLPNPLNPKEKIWQPGGDLDKQLEKAAKSAEKK
ncbi:MAG: hypothetical protein G01um101419_398 [Parcubacteria group bacterium Gr01-1014_19]|nr:MAG: hypothetical protein G01um101419_398 [Parcubacteria group bacterium Gr01-1014_19]